MCRLMGRLMGNCVYVLDVGAIAAKGYYTYSGKQHYILDLNCTGNESTVWNCSYNGISGYSCPDSHDASVSCQGLNHLYV